MDQIDEIKKINELKSEIDDEQTDAEKDAEGRVVIPLQVNGDSGFLSPYSVKGNCDISMEVADFIERNAEQVDARESLHFKIYSNDVTEQEKIVYEKAIRTHYKQEYKRMNKEVKKHNTLAIVFAGIAILVLGFMFIAEALGFLNAITTEIIDITAWVFMWEAVYILFLQRPADKIKELRYLKIFDSRIEFLPLED